MFDGKDNNVIIGYKSSLLVQAMKVLNTQIVNRDGMNVISLLRML